MKNDVLKQSYIIIILIYLGSATKWTYYTFSSPTYNVGTYISIILTIFIIIKNRLSFKNKYLMFLLSLLALWSIILSIKYKTVEIPYTILYDFLVGYVIIKLYKGSYILYLEKSIYILTICGLVFYIITTPLYPMSYQLLESIGGDNNMNYVTSNIWVYGTIREDFNGSIFSLRNTGFCWEPGRFASIIVLGYALFLFRSNFNIFCNKSYLYFFTLLTTQSTTGVSIVLVLFVAYLYNKKRKRLFVCLLTFIPIIFVLFSLPFMNEKITNIIKESGEKSELRLSNIEYYSNRDDVLVPQRFEGIQLEALNILSDPLFGYGKNIKRSFVGILFDGNVVLYNGILKLFACFGIIFGFIYFYYFIIKPSSYISEIYSIKGKYWLLLVIVGINVSYYFIYEPLFIALGLLPYEVAYEKSRSTPAV